MKREQRERANKMDCVKQAVEELIKNTSFRISYKIKQDKQKKGIDGIINLTIDNKNAELPYEVKKDPRQHHLLHLQQLQQQQLHQQLLLVAHHISGNIRVKLKELGINYIDAVGNAFIKHNDLFIYLDGFSNKEKLTLRGDQLLNPAALKLIFHFLVKPEWINLTYREIHNNVNVSLDTVSKTINSLKNKKYLIEVSGKELRLRDKKSLLDYWMKGFQEKLQAKILIGRFRFVKDVNGWENLFGDTKTLWGGEPAAFLLTKYLNPEIFTVFTSEKESNLLKKYKLAKDANGKVLIYENFCNKNLIVKNCVHPLLVYTELMNTQDNRNIETAKLIYEKYLGDLFKE